MRVEINVTIRHHSIMIEELCIYSLHFIYKSEQQKPYTKTVIKHIYRITIWNNMLNILQTSTCQGKIRNEIILLNLI